MLKIKQNPFLYIIVFYIVCFIFRAVEYMVIRTDQSIIGEAFIHKVIGIILLCAALKFLQYKWNDIGFKASSALKDIGIGLLLGGIVFFISYSTEMIILFSSGNTPELSFYATGYAIQGNRKIDDGFIFILICIIGNIINVVMEEGIFRGLFVRLSEEKHSFAKACIVSSALFGLWHIAQPIRNMIDGVQSPMGAFMSGLMLVATSTLLGVQFCMLQKITGSIWAGMVIHFINNAGTNLIHVVTASGNDELQTIRITIAQTLLFFVILIIYIIKVKKDKTISHNNNVIAQN